MRLWKRDKTSIFDAPIAQVLDEMKVHHPETKEYRQLVKHLNQLMKMKQQGKRRPPSTDTMLIVAGNLLGILAIIAYEQKHVMASKGMGFILKPK